MLLFAQKQTTADVQNEATLKILPVLWQQTAAEYRALCYQAFNLATLRINEIPQSRLNKKNLAIITDLDETILDNSPQEAALIKNNAAYSSKDWAEWTRLAVAEAVPGAVEFLQMASKKGISIFYISNRDTAEVQSTLLNLKKLQLPDADLKHMLFKSNDASKEVRRQEIMKKYNVIMLMGDNLNDFTKVFEKGSITARKDETDKVKDEWGKKFIVLPNSTYGEWENAIYNYSHKLTPLQKDSIRLHLLKSYK
jgi:5'-nucleotidase (lipoprotein e(P4) family)